MLYRTLQAHWRTFLGDLAAHDGGGGLPRFIVDEVEAYLKCGILAHGFLRVLCQACGETRLVALSCKRRGFCGSCLGRRMCDFATHLVDQVVPFVPVRQWVLTVPHRLRYKMAFDPDLTSFVLRTFISAVSAWLRKKARLLGARGALQTGAITVIQRFGSSLNLNVHLHTILVDGVYQIGPGEDPIFHRVPPPSDEEVAQTVAKVQRKIMAKSAVTNDFEVGPRAQKEPLLATLANASVAGLIATGPRAGCRILRVGSAGQKHEVTLVGKRCATVEGFNLHANVAIAAKDRQGLEHLARYICRPPIGANRLTELPDGRLALRLRRSFSDGSESVIFTPGELIEKLLNLIPRPRTHAIRFHGFFAPAAKIRAKVVPTPTPVATIAPGDAPASPAPKKPSPSRLPWAELQKRVFLTDVLDCPKCHGRMRILAVIMTPDVVRRILQHENLPADPPSAAPARPPPQAMLGFGAEGADPPAPDEFGA